MKYLSQMLCRRLLMSLPRMLLGHDLFSQASADFCLLLTLAATHLDSCSSIRGFSTCHDLSSRSKRMICQGAIKEISYYSLLLGRQLAWRCKLGIGARVDNPSYAA